MLISNETRGGHGCREWGATPPPPSEASATPFQGTSQLLLPSRKPFPRFSPASELRLTILVTLERKIKLETDGDLGCGREASQA